jgi:hypothetical protein
MDANNNEFIDEIVKLNEYVIKRNGVGRGIFQ